MLALAGVSEPPAVEIDVPVALARFNLRPDLPDLALFPRADWSAAERASLQRAANTDLAYGEPFGAAELRHRLAPFLVRTRGVVASADRTGVHAGSTQALLVVAEALRAEGVRRIGVEDPGHRWRTRTLEASGLDVVPIPVDADGLRIDALDGVDAVVVSPDHHFPSWGRARARPPAGACRVGGSRRLRDRRARLRRALSLRPSRRGNAAGARTRARRVRR